jgi:hypothetical protein
LGRWLNFAHSRSDWQTNSKYAVQISRNWLSLTGTHEAN